LEIKSEDICIIPGYRLTEYKVFNGEDIVETYFNIRDEQGHVHGRNFDEIEWPLNLLLCVDSKMTTFFRLDKTTQKIALYVNS
jgi:hypothetical protein